MPNTPSDVRTARFDRATSPRESDLSVVLLVEDDEDSREMMAEYLGSLGYVVEVAATGPEALARGLSLVPAVVLLDMSLPGLGGLEVAARLRADPSTRDVPIVALTGRELEAADRATFAAVVMKPADLDRLHGLVRDLVGRASERRPTR